MARKVSEIYKEYKIFPRLEKHMLRVAAVAHFLCDNIDIPIDKEKIVTICLLHDLGNLVKVDFRYFNDFTEEEIIFWEKQKEEFISKYGDTDHKANFSIAKELALGEDVANIIGGHAFSNFCDISTRENWYEKILLYADCRVGPDGILSYEERMEESKKRYAQSNFGGVERSILVGCGKDVEKQIFNHCKIKPEDITPQLIEPMLEKLREYVIQ
ncbi:HD domain-containing protein [Patescibacteria group bacterium]|nr:HD domain-containing protein [Patescibacteria group bacterium]